MPIPSLDREARALYDACPTVKPTWEQLGEVTRGVWRQYAKLKLAGVTDYWRQCYQWPHLDLTKTDTITAVRILATRVAGDLRRTHLKDVQMTTKLNTTKLAEQFDELAALLIAISGTFRAAGDGGDGAADERKAGGKPAAKTTGKSKPAPKEEEATSELTEDDIREALKELAAAKGKDVMVEALNSVGAEKLGDVDESQYQDLMDKINELKEAEDEPEPTSKSKSKPAAKKAKKAGPTLEELTEAAKALIDADKPAYLKIVKKFGKPSEIEADQYGPMLEAIKAAMPEGEDEELL